MPLNLYISYLYNLGSSLLKYGYINITPQKLRLQGNVLGTKIHLFADNDDLGVNVVYVLIVNRIIRHMGVGI